MRYLIKKLLKKFKIKDYAATNWKQIISEHKKEFELIKKKANGKKILIATSTGGQLFCSHFESLLAFALTYYGARVEILLCDKVLPACMMATSKFIDEESFSKNGPSKVCNSCFDSGKFAFDGLGLKVNYYSQFITDKDIKDLNETIDNLTYDQLSDYKEDDINIGEHSLAGALRYYAVGDLLDQKYKDNILRSYVKAGTITKKVMNNFFIKNSDFEIIILNHAIYIPQGIINSVSKKYGKKIVSYVSGYRKNSFIFSHDDTYHFTMVDEPTSEWEDLNLNSIRDQRIMNYLNSRKFGTDDWTYYFDNPKFEIKDSLIAKGVDLGKPIIVMATNIIWDANLIYKDNIFLNQMNWIYETIDYFKSRNNLQLIIRAHPGEINYDRISNQRVKDELIKKYKILPKNIFIIGPEENLSTYPLVYLSNTLLIYASKVGMEFPPFGTNVVVAGESYVKNKGITIDPKTKKEYFEILDKIPLKIKKDVSKITRAKKYAYHFFFKKTIVPNSLKEEPTKWPIFTIKSNVLDNLKKGNDKPLKSICDSIINYKPFAYDEVI
ncbi:hypothetical protein OAV64_04860 [Candidatus Pelagibacter sp.]|nr:hypothetical protein [Candidatus Pelagibacter sp.]